MLRNLSPHELSLHYWSCRCAAYDGRWSEIGPLSIRENESYDIVILIDIPVA